MSRGNGRGSRGAPAAAPEVPAVNTTPEGMYGSCMGQAHTVADELPESLRRGLVSVETLDPGGHRFERFAYVVQGPLDAVGALGRAQGGAGSHLADMRLGDGIAFALIYSRQPIHVGDAVSPVGRPERRLLDWLPASLRK
jgi:hypothetical protein